MRKHHLPAIFCLITLLPPVPAALPAQTPAASPARQLGTVKSVDGNTVTLFTAAGATISVPLAPDARVLQLPPGSTDLKAAQPGALTDIAIGDRISTGKAGDTDTASRVILMKSADIAARKVTQQADWQQRGTGGIVRTVAGSIIEVSAGPQTLRVVTSPSTLFRRYADDSIKFEAATPGTLDQIRPGDQLRVRGARTEAAPSTGTTPAPGPSGPSITAEEVVSGTFDSFSGSLTALDPTAGTLTLQDLTTKKPVTIKVTANSDLRKLPPQAAAALTTHTPANSSAPQDPSQALSQMLPKLPPVTLAALHPGDSVLIVASQDRARANPAVEFFTAITLLAGVEQILSASSSGARPVTLSPWNLGSPDTGAPQ